MSRKKRVKENAAVRERTKTETAGKRAAGSENLALDTDGGVSERMSDRASEQASQPGIQPASKLEETKVGRGQEAEKKRVGQRSRLGDQSWKITLTEVLLLSWLLQASSVYGERVEFETMSTSM